MPKILMLQPVRIHKRWPVPEDFTGLLGASPTLAFAQLRAKLKNYEADYMDGLAREYSLAELTRRAKAVDVVLINAHSSVGALNAEANVRHILDNCPGVPIIMGGHHATVYDFQWLGRGAHFVVRNEGEETIVELLEAIFKGGSYDEIKGISWQGPGNEFHRNPPRSLIKNLDDLPIPDWGIYDKKLYHLPLPIKGYSTTAETSRGCPYHCSFCAASEMWMHKQRFKSPERVLEELRILGKLGFTKIWFADDNFGQDPERYAQIYEGILRENMKFNFVVFIRSDNIVKSPEVMRLAHRAGMRVALVGIESAVDRLLTDCSKVSEAETSRKAVEILREIGIFIGGFLMVGYLDEKQDETDTTFRAANEMTDYPIISIFEPRFGTKDFVRAKAKLDTPGGDMFYHNTEHFIPSMVHVLPQYRDFYRRYLTHPKQINKLLFGTPTQKKCYRTLYMNLAKSVLRVTPAMLANPWEMTRDIYK